MVLEWYLIAIAKESRGCKEGALLYHSVVMDCFRAIIHHFIQRKYGSKVHDNWVGSERKNLLILSTIYRHCVVRYRRAENFSL